MRRRMMAIAAAVCLCGSLSGCGDSSSDGSSIASVSSAAESSAADGTGTESSAAEELPASILSGQITLNGETIMLPCPLKALYANGWTDADQGGTGKNLEKNGSCISVGCEKDGDEDIVCRLECYFGFNTNEVTLPGGVVLGKTMRADVLAAYGEPDEYYHADSPENEDNFEYVYLDENGEKLASAYFQFDGNRTNPDYTVGAIWGVKLSKYE